MIKYSVKNVHDQKIDQWIKLGVNVCFVGEHGTGKTQRVLEGFERNKLKYVYFSGATLDPWLHLIGVPDVTEADKEAAGRKVIDFILPRGIDENLEGIFMDEYNRSHKVVRNALLELQQFKSINGRKFPKLRLVWAAINPPKDEDEIGFQYDVDEPDPAQIDRFQVIVEIPSIPDPKYFKKRFGDHIGGILTKWWKQQADEGKAACSPRRLEYAGDLFFKGADLSDILPPVCNVGKLVKMLGEREEDAILKRILADPTGKEAKDFLSKPDNYFKVKDELDKAEYFPAYRFVSDEILATNISEKPEFRRFLLASAVAGETWAKKAVKDNSLKTELEAVSAVLDNDWQENYRKDAVDLDTVKLPLSNREAKSKEQLESFNKAIKNGNYNIPQHFYNGIINEVDSKSFANTYWHRRVLYFLCSCHELVDPILLINILASIYGSMQASTLKDFSGFDKIFNRIVLESFNRMDSKDRGRAASLLSSLESKHDNYSKLLALLNGSSNDEWVGALPKDVDNIIANTLATI